MVSCTTAHLPWARSACSISGESIKLGRIAANYCVARGGRQVAQFALNIFLGIRPDAVGVREIRTPHDIVFTDFVEQLDADAIALVGRVALPPPVVTRLHLEIQIFELVLPAVDCARTTPRKLYRESRTRNRTAQQVTGI